jgi:sugar/nucleoside kinase (ribokinase family)
MDVVTIGHTSVDRVTISGTKNVQLGGAAVYSAMAAIVSRVGGDFTPDFEKILNKAGIGTEGLKKVKGKSSYFSINYDKHGSATYGSYDLNVGIHIRPGDIPSSYLDAKAFHIAPMAPSKQRKFIEYLRKNFDGIVSLNTHMGYMKRRKEVLKLLADVDIFTLNDEEALALTKTKRIEVALNVLKKEKHNLIAITIGSIGSGVLEGSELTFFPSVSQPRVKDLTGCGDAFAGSFISSYIKTKNPLKAANIASSVASINATDWNFKAIRTLKFKDIQAFQEFIFSRQRKLQKHQWSIEHFF